MILDLPGHIAQVTVTSKGHDQRGESLSVGKEQRWLMLHPDLWHFALLQHVQITEFGSCWIVAAKFVQTLLPAAQNKITGFHQRTVYSTKFRMNPIFEVKNYTIF